MMPEPPPFQEADRCDVCKCSFGTFRRRHHCRCCGRTLCHDHSSDQMALPQFGIYTDVRVCADCFNNSARPKIINGQTSADVVSSVAEEVSRIDIGSGSNSAVEPAMAPQFAPPVIECKCGMPLCICEAPEATKEVLAPPPKPSPTVSTSSNVKPKRTDTGSRNKGSTSNTNHGSVFNHGQMTNATEGRATVDYEANGEGAREAIKNGDTVALKKLLNEGVDANYRDRQGMSLLHLAAVFNRTDISFILMESGASINCKNAQGETPLDCAPVTLQYKMKQKLEGSGL